MKKVEKLFDWLDIFLLSKIYALFFVFLIIYKFNPMGHICIYSEYYNLRRKNYNNCIVNDA